jgi:hypothetical protein
MIWQYSVAGMLTLLAAVLHAIAGERTNIQHLLATDMLLTEKIELRATWHFGSIGLAFAGIGLLAVGITDQPAVGPWTGYAVAITLGSFALVWIICTVISDRRLLLRVPQWILLLAIALLGWWGAATP